MLQYGFAVNRGQIFEKFAVRAPLLALLIAGSTVFSNAHANVWRDYINEITPLVQRAVLGVIMQDLPRNRGSVTIRVRLRQNGEIGRVDLEESSGNREFDALVIREVNRIATFPRPPAGVILRQAVDPIRIRIGLGDRVVPMEQAAGASSSTSDYRVKNDSVVSRDGVVWAIQLRLKEQGYLRGAVDGIYGPATRSAIKAYQVDNNLLPSGQASELLLEHMDDNRTTTRIRTEGDGPVSTVSAAPSSSDEAEPAVVAGGHGGGVETQGIGNDDAFEAGAVSDIQPRCEHLVPRGCELLAAVEKLCPESGDEPMPDPFADHRAPKSWPDLNLDGKIVSLVLRGLTIDEFEKAFETEESYWKTVSGYRSSDSMEVSGKTAGTSGAPDIVSEIRAGFRESQREVKAYAAPDGRVWYLGISEKYEFDRPTVKAVLSSLADRFGSPTMVGRWESWSDSSIRNSNKSKYEFEYCRHLKSRRNRVASTYAPWHLVDTGSFVDAFDEKSLQIQNMVWGGGGGVKPMVTLQYTAHDHVHVNSLSLGFRDPSLQAEASLAYKKQRLEAADEAAGPTF